MQNSQLSRSVFHPHIKFKRFTLVLKIKNIKTTFHNGPNDLVLFSWVFCKSDIYWATSKIPPGKTLSYLICWRHLTTVTFDPQLNCCCVLGHHGQINTLAHGYQNSTSSGIKIARARIFSNIFSLGLLACLPIYWCETLRGRSNLDWCQINS